MAFMTKNSYGESMNILDSEVGLVRKTREATASMAVKDGNRLTLKAGTLFTGTDEVGVVFQDYDMTDYEKLPISVVFQGRLRSDRVSAEALAKKEDFAKQGLYLV